MLFRRKHNDALRRCPACAGRLVCPMDWAPEDDKSWTIDLRCGDCAHTWNRVVANDRARRFDVELDNDVNVIERSLRRLEREHMEADVKAFVAALARDLIEPVDFAR
jgi:hypothetical protein